jgi:plastocyanin
VSAQTTPTGKLIAVTVGLNGTLTFSPDNVTASVGDMVQFQFVAGNHTATQSNFDNPCQPISMHNASATGFHSGFQPAAASKAMGMTSVYTVPINDTKPIWVYCAQAKHCEAGMVMVINEK